MIRTLNETGRDDILRALRDGELKPLQVYDAFRTNELHRLPLGEVLKSLRGEMLRWIEGVDCSAAQKAAHKTAMTKLTEYSRVVNDLPRCVQAYRESCRKAKTPAQFNRVRASALAFVRDTLKRSHRLYGEVRDIPLMKEKKSPARRILTWSEVQTIAGKMGDPRDRSALYGMVLTGMGPKEWYRDGWRVDSNRVTIHGEKRTARHRVVPAVKTGAFLSPKPGPDVGVEREQRRFGERLVDVAGVHPYDLRRSYANWLEAAGVPRTRRKAYMGHAGGDVTSLYERHEVEQFLAEDARRIEAYLDQTSVTTPITLMKGGTD